MRTNVWLAAVLLVPAAAWAEKAAPKAAVAAAPWATGKVEAKSGSKVSGKVTFTVDKTQVTLKLEVEGATPGDHAVHLHEKGDCSDPDQTSALRCSGW